MGTELIYGSSRSAPTAAHEPVVQLPQRHLLRRLARLHGARRHLDAHLFEAVVRVAEDQELLVLGDVADDFVYRVFYHRKLSV